MIVRAPAKLNLCLYLGPRRDDGLHELRSIFCPLALADRIEVGSDERDQVICPAVDGPNLAAAALAGLRERGWRGPPLRIEIDKRIPVAAGLGGGSADAAAVLRLGEGQVNGLRELAAELGADVTSQLDPSFALVGGAGEIVERLPDPGEFAVVLVPLESGLAAGDVYAEADRLGLGRTDAELDEVADRIKGAARRGASPLSYLELLHNDLEEAAVSLRPEIGEALAALRDAGAAAAFVTGSGPTAVGVFEHIVAADRATDALGPRWARAIVSAPAGVARTRE
jgi:4-diphosphocytidyl-2-C-methyl-D-erythritol kinase